jgi:hypothetical protein
MKRRGDGYGEESDEKSEQIETTGVESGQVRTPGGEERIVQMCKEKLVTNLELAVKFTKIF